MKRLEKEAKIQGSFGICNPILFLAFATVQKGAYQVAFRLTYPN